MIHDERGVSIMGTIFTLIILGVMGAALVGIVASEQETRKICLTRERAFYTVQAGLEYALREINEGGYPIVTDKQFDHSAFTIAIDPDTRKITVTGKSADSSRTHSITTDLLAKDCAAMDTSGASLGGPYSNVLTGIVIDHDCLMAVNIAQITVAWTPDYGGTVRRIRIDGQDVYDEAGGTASGQPIDVTDYRFVTQASLDEIEFSSSMSGKSIDIALTFTDSSSVESTGISP